MVARFPRKTFRATDEATGAWFEADAILCAITGRVGWMQVRSGFPADFGMGAVVDRLNDDVCAQANLWCRKKCGREAVPWGRIGEVS